MTQPELEINIPPPPIPHPDGTGRLPTWIAEQLHTNRPGNRRRATFHRCRRCDQIVFTGLDDDIAAATVTADPTPLTPHAELAALLAGRATYNLTKAGQRLELDPRTAHDIRKPHTTTVVPDHHCGHRFPGFTHPAIPAPSRHDDPPPF